MIDSEHAPDLGAVFDAHIKAEFADRDVAATMATMSPDPFLTHVPTMTGGTGRAEVERFYREHFIGHWPDDVQVTQVSRTIGQNRVIDELIVSFTHDREMRAFLPGVAPTGRAVTLPHVVVMGFDDSGRVAFERIYWDQASLLVQIGLLDASLYPVTGAEQAKRVLDPTRPANGLIRQFALGREQGTDGSIEVTEEAQREPARDPQDLEQLLVARQRAGDIDGAVALFEPDAVIDVGGGRLLRGRQALRDFLEEYTTAGGKFQVGVQQAALIAGDLALTSTRSRNGSVTAEVARRQSDGTWLWIIDRYSIAHEGGGNPIGVNRTGD